MNKNAKRLIAAASLIITDLLAIACFRRFGSLLFPAYRSFSKAFLNVLSIVFSIVPFTLWDLSIIFFALLVIIAIVKRIKLSKILSVLALVASILFTVALFCWLLNHYAPPLSDYLELDVGDNDVTELAEATKYYFDKAVEYSFEMKRDGEDHLLYADYKDIGVKAGKAYEMLDNPIFKGSSRPVKNFSIIGDYLLYNGITGMFMPVSAEAAIPRHEAIINYPFSMTHEAAHRLGIASEQEANFCAFLACINNDDAFFRYSGYYNAFWYCYRALYRADADMVSLLNIETSDTTLLSIDRQDELSLYRQYQSPLRKVSDQINDTYLKSFGQSSGIASYGEVVDYLIAYYQTIR